MGAWIKVVTHPLGLAGFALFLVFTVLAKQKKAAKMHWALYGAACIALIGGLLLAYREASPQDTGVKRQQMKIGTIEQKSSGNGAVNAAGVQGDVNASPDKSRAEKSAPEKEEKKESTR